MAERGWFRATVLVVVLVGAGLLGWAAGNGSRAAAPGVAPAQPGRQVVQQFVSGDTTLNYLLFLPAGYGQDDRDWPMLLFLHGAYGAGSDFDRVKHYVLPRLVEQQPDFPFILVSPQAPEPSWDTAVLHALIDHLAGAHRVDRRRISLTGASLGAAATWRLAAAAPTRFAAIMPLSGVGDPAAAAPLRDLPIWVFHGGKDDRVPPSASERMVDALRAAGSTRVKYTLYPDAGHDTFLLAYRDPQVWEWLLQQRRAR